MILAFVDAIARLFGAGMTERRASVEFGQAPAERYAYWLASYSDRELMTRDRDEILTEVRARIAAERRAAARIQERAEALSSRKAVAR